MKYADLFDGQVIDAGTYTLTEDEVLDFARKYDPQWFHVDPQAAAAGPFGGLIASGWQTCGIAMRLATEAVLEGSEAAASPGLAYLKWPSAVRPGDTLALRATVLEKRSSRSRPSLGVMRWRLQMINQRGDEVLDMEATTLFNLGA